MYSLNSGVKTSQRIRSFLIVLGLVLVLALSLRASRFELHKLFTGASQSAELVREMFPPDFSNFLEVLRLTAETLSVGFWGTFLGTLLSIPLALLSASNTSNRFLYPIARYILSLLRAVPELLYALLFVIAIGLGPFAGVLALIFHTVGLLGKFLSESIESIDPRPVEAIRSAGASPLGAIRYAVLPQVLPLFVGYFLYMLDHNVRVAIALGIVGVGGLGVELFTAMRTFDYQRALTIIVVISILITLLDRISAKIRGDIIEGRAVNKPYLLVLSLLGLSSVYFIPLEISNLGHRMVTLWEFIVSMYPPDFSTLGIYVKLMVETVAIAISGTFLAVLMALPLGFGSARNIVHLSLLVNLFREVNNFLRAIPEIVLALIFVAAVGLGPFAGVLAIALHTAGFLGKFYAEVVENIDRKPLEAIEATGTSFLQKLRFAVLPQVIPLFNSYSLYILDRNVRAATTMGLVGAGGIGFELIMSIKLFDYQRTATILMVVISTIMLIDWLSFYLRRRTL
ncbi:MAG: phosphonate ABC transporter, permease protein PhnE [Acidobacteria bacterium]|jgi:phosphonate transport system permease protein|nr:MAG: phosphonate ABC transporter, permease protein PhnE [Acidobacteriota bacterium]